MPSDGGGENRSEPAGTEFVEGETANEPLLPSPLQAYRLRPSELTRITYARGLFVDRCMRAAGFSYPQRPFSQELDAMLESERTAISRRYGITDPDLASTYGYGFPATSTSGGFASVERDELYLDALRGNATGVSADASRTTAADDQEPDRGCVGEADRRLSLTDPDISAFGLAHSIWVEGQQRLVISKQYRTVVGEWATCMGRRGYRVSDPISDQHDIAEAFHTRGEADDRTLIGPPLAEEIALATADVACKQATRLVERLDTLSAAIDRRSIANHRPALESDHRRLARTLSMSTELLEQLKP